MTSVRYDKVQRFSPEELLALRRAPTRPLGKMPVLGSDISIIVSEEPLEPVTATPADQEAISRVSNAGLFFLLSCAFVETDENTSVMPGEENVYG